jgi:hypothetical protein
MHSKSIRAKIGLVAVALLIALCQMALAQGDADLAAPGLEPFPTTSIGSPTLCSDRPAFTCPKITQSPPHPTRNPRYIGFRSYR